ncbi:MAG TPA: hypothetical protein VJA94_13210, partial [Candidatus Angelobacter sp.]
MVPKTVPSLVADRYDSPRIKVTSNIGVSRSSTKCLASLLPSRSFFTIEFYLLREMLAGISLRSHSKSSPVGTMLTLQVTLH